MPSDAHAHPRDLLRLFPGAETERRALGIACAASAWNAEEFSFHEELAAAAKNEAPLFPCFAIHPQLPASNTGKGTMDQTTQVTPEYTTTNPAGFQDKLDLLAALAKDSRLAAVGETGFDLYSEKFRETESAQDALFAAHLEIARQYDLPMVLHVRRAMHKIFPYTKNLKTLPAVVFHSWPGSPDEGLSLLRRGVPAFFSFGTTLLLNHKNAIRSCAAFPSDHLLLETDAPWQPLKGKDFSSWADLNAILKAAANIRKEAGTSRGEPEELERITDSNFFAVFGKGK